MLTMTRNLPSSICNVSVYPGTCTAADADFTTAIQKVRIEGVEFQWRWQPFDSTRLMIGQAWTEVYADFLDSVLPGSGVTTLLKDFNYEKLDLQTKRSTPSSASSFLWMQRLPGGLDFSLAGYWVGPMQWTRNSSVDFYRRFDARLGYPFNVGGQRGEIAYTAQSINGDHGEFKASGQPSDRVVELRHWLTLRVEL
jgi:iron complex outermembrane receptor protein